MTPLDITEVSGSVIAFLVPYLSTKAKEYAEEKISEEVKNKIDSEIASLYKRIKSRFVGNSEAKKSLENLEKDPENLEFQRKTERILEDILIRDVQFRENIEKLLLDIKKLNQLINNSVVNVNATNGSWAAGKDMYVTYSNLYQVQQPSSNPTEPYIPFKISEEKAKKEFRWQMIQGDYTPDDILTKSTFNKNFRLYIPFHLVIGTYSALLTYIAVTREDYEETVQEDVGEQKITVNVPKTRYNRTSAKKEIYPQKFKELTIATGLNSLFSSGLKISGLEEFCEEFNFLEEDIKTDVKASIDGIKYITPSYKRSDSESKIKARIEGRINSTIYKGLEGNHQEKEKLTTNVNVEEVKRLYLPCWFFIYSYNDKEYLLVMDGKDLKRVYNKHKPIDQEKHKKKQEIYWKHFQKFALNSAGIFILIYIIDKNIFVTNFFMLLIVVFSLAVISFLVANSKVKGMIKESKQRREEVYKYLNEEKETNAMK